MQKKMNTCRDLNLQYTRRQSLGDYIHCFLFYGFYPIKQTFLFVRIAKSCAEILICGSQKNMFSSSLILRFDSGYIF